MGKSIDSTDSLLSLKTCSNILLPDGAEASDINGVRAFEALSEVSEKSNSTNKSISAPKTTKRSNIRKDVVWKSLLRAMKKHYSREFKNFADQKVINRPDCHTVAISKASEFLKAKLQRDIPEQTEIFLLALIDQKGTMHQENERYPKLNARITNLLRYFTSKKLKDLLTFHQFSALISAFLTQPDAIDSLAEKAYSDKKSKRVFKKYA